MQIDPRLAAFVKQFQTDDGQDFAANAAIRIQRHQDAQAVANAQAAAHQQFVQKVSAFRDGMAQYAKTPGNADLALDLAEMYMNGLTKSTGQTPEAHAGLLGEIQGEIAHAAVQGLAERDLNAANAALSSGRLADLLPDDQKTALGQYAQNMAQQRAVDSQARQAEIVRQHVAMSGRAAAKWMNSLTDPSTGQLQFPDNWSARMTTDPRMSPMDKAALQNAYRGLLTNGNPDRSDPSLVSSLLDRAALPHNDPGNPSVGEVLSHVGAGLSLRDAQFIAGRVGPQSPDVDASTSRISQVLGDARGQIGNDRAYGRFVDWLLPALGMGASLDPNAKEYALTPERMAAFQPTGADIIAPTLVGTATTAGRRSLGEIFGSIFSPKPQPGVGEGEIAGTGNSKQTADNMNTARIPGTRDQLDAPDNGNAGSWERYSDGGAVPREGTNVATQGSGAMTDVYGNAPYSKDI